MSTAQKRKRASTSNDDDHSAGNSGEEMDTTSEAKSTIADLQRKLQDAQGKNTQFAVDLGNLKVELNKAIETARDAELESSDLRKNAQHKSADPAAQRQSQRQRNRQAQSTSRSTEAHFEVAAAKQRCDQLVQNVQTAQSDLILSFEQHADLACAVVKHELTDAEEQTVLVELELEAANAKATAAENRARASEALLQQHSEQLHTAKQTITTLQ